MPSFSSTRSFILEIWEREGLGIGWLDGGAEGGREGACGWMYLVVWLDVEFDLLARERSHPCAHVSICSTALQGHIVRLRMDEPT